MVLATVNWWRFLHHLSARVRKSASVTALAILITINPFSAAVATADGDAEETRKRPVVIVSIAPQRSIVKQLLGPLAQIEVMIPAGASPETFEPSISQMQQLSSARAYIAVGHPRFAFENQLVSEFLTVNTNGSKSAGVLVKSSAGLSLNQDDPHWWLSPQLVAQSIPHISNKLCQVFDAHCKDIVVRSEDFARRIEVLQQEIAAELSSSESSAFLVFHPSWGYFAQEFGLTQLAIEQHGLEPSPSHVAEVIRQAKALGISSVFVQPQFNKALAGVVARELDASVRVLDPLAEYWAENLLQAARAIRRGGRDE